MTFADHLIDALGGSTAVSRAIDAPLSTVHSWRRNGIPSSRRAHLKLVARDLAIEIDWETGQVVDGSHDEPANPQASSAASGKAEELSVAEAR